MSKKAVNLRVGRKHPWPALFALLAACASDPAPTSKSDCTDDSSDCECTEEGTSCDSAQGAAPRSPTRDAGTSRTVDAQADDDADEDDDGSEPSGSTGDDDAKPTADAAARDGGAGDARIRSTRDAGEADDERDASGPAVPDEPDQPDVADGFVGAHGALRVKGNRVVDRRGEPIQLRGMSWFWSQWTDFYAAKNVDVMVDEWKSTVVRAVLGVENDGGYLEAPQANVDKIRVVVDRAIERGVYVIIDWHDHHAQNHTAQATAFFKQMAEAYGDDPHVIFEIYNEPMDVDWPVVKGYAEQIIRTIRDAGSENLIIVGTPNWSQDVDTAAASPITSDDNIAYTLHFYADTHKQFLRDKAKTALDRGIALFVTEWGTCSADGNGNVNPGETETWLRFMREHSLSWANWALNDKAEACSAIQPAGGSVGPWRDDQLTPSGRLIKPAIR